MWSAKLLSVVVVLGTALALAAAQQPGDNGLPHPDTPNPIVAKVSLLDTYIQLLQAAVSVAPQQLQSGRNGRTTVEVKLSGATSVNPYSPTIAPEVTGTVFDVLNTWDALKSLAIAYRKADKLRPLSSHSRPLFPMGSQATRLASISSSGQAAVSAFAENRDSPSSLVRFPPNLLMIPFGQTTGAIADLLDVAYDEAADSITMRMDVVDNPVVFSQFMEHHPCSADTTEAHYHQNVREGIDVNAKALLQSVKDSSNTVQGVHIFLKSEPLLICYGAYFTPTTAVLPVGQSLNVTIAVESCAKRGVPDNSIVFVEVVPGTGNGIITQTSPYNAERHVAETLARQQRNGASTAYTLNGQAWFVVQSTVAGSFSVVTTDINKVPSNPPGRINITTSGGSVSKLVLEPHKAYRRCGDHITLAATALDSNHVPVGGANVFFSAYGDCTPEYAQYESSATTDASGIAHVTLKSNTPCAVAVCAAVHIGNGSVVTTEPAHIIFFDEHSYAERREQEYFGGDDRRRYSSGYEEEEAEDHSRDAWRYGREAAKLAEQRALSAPASGST